MKRCTRCILPEDYPNIRFNSAGVCNVCEAWDARWAGFDYQKSEQELIGIFEAAKAKMRKYDCLIPFSGGRDSSYVLYLCTEKYKLNPLAVTFNNTFMSGHAINNITKLVNKLGVDHVMLSYKPKLLNRYYRTMIKEGGEFCSICTAGINHAWITYQRLYNIPLVISGTSTRVDEQSPFEVNSTHPLYVRRVLSQDGISKDEIDALLIKKDADMSAAEKIRMKLQDADFVSINLPDYLHWDNARIQDDLDNILGWETPDEKADHIDCQFAPMKYYLKNLQMPHYIFKQQKYSQLIRDGQIAREAALAALEELMAHENEEPAEFGEFMSFFQLSPEDVYRKDKKCYLDYIRKDELAAKEDTLFTLAATPWRIYKKVRGIK